MPFIERFWTVEWSLPAGHVHHQRVVGFPSVELVLEPGQARVWGVARRLVCRRFSGNGSVVGTKFKPGGFAALFDIDVSTLTDTHVPLATLSEPLDRVLAASPDAAGTFPGARHVPLIEAALRPLIRGRHETLAMIGRCFRLARRRHARPSIAQLATLCGVSSRSLERAFRRYVGVSPKFVLRRLRLIDALALIERQVRPDWRRLALDFGYVDQSHFINDFTSQVGVSPRMYLKGDRS